MSLKLPPSDHPASKLFEREHLATVASPENRGHLARIGSACAAACQALIDDPCAVSVNTVCRDHTGDILLITVNRQGLYDLVWNFGQ